jgi:hypothetical protein
MRLINYYIDYFYFNLDTYPLVVKIAVSIILFFLFFNLGVIIVSLFQKLFKKNKKNIVINKEDLNYQKLIELLVNRENIEFDSLRESIFEFDEDFKKDWKTIISMLMSIKLDCVKYLSDEFNYHNSRNLCRIFDLGVFWDERLTKGSYKEKMDTLNEIIELNATISESILATLVYHKNNELRKRARLAQIHLSKHDPFRFFEEDFDKDFTRWDKIKIHDILLRRSVKTIPNFARWVPIIENVELKCLFIYEIGYFLQVENRAYLFDLFKTTKEDKVKIECLNSLSLLGIQEYKDSIIDLYSVCSEDVQVVIIRSLKNINRENKILKFFVNAFDKTYETSLKIEIGQTMYNFGDNGKKVVDVLEQRGEGFEKLIFEHIKNPLLQNY